MKKTVSDGLVLLVALREDLVPELLHAVHDGDDAAILALVRILARLALLRDLRGGRVLAHALVVERAELPGEPSAASGERGHEQVDDEDGDADPAAADREAARAADSAPANIPYLARIEPGAFAKPHEASITGRLSAPNA